MTLIQALDGWRDESDKAWAEVRLYEAQITWLTSRGEADERIVPLRSLRKESRARAVCYDACCADLRAAMVGMGVAVSGT